MEKQSPESFCMLPLLVSLTREHGLTGLSPSSALITPPQWADPGRASYLATLPFLCFGANHAKLL